MNFDHRHYVPCLRWKQGEYQAVQLLSASAREIITPLIEVAEPGFDFETRTTKKTLDDHLAPFARRVEAKWDRRPCFVDLTQLDPEDRMADGRHPVRFVFDDLKARGCPAVPVTGLSRDDAYQQAVMQVEDNRGLCLRLHISEAARSNLKASMDALLRTVPPDKCDLILDLGAPNNFEPISGFARVVLALIRSLPHLKMWRTLTLLGTSFPSSMAVIRSSPATVPRNEWLLYQAVAMGLAKAKLRIPSFGDYCINHPSVLQLDLRLLKPSATIRYTTERTWFIIKGPNVRENQFEQYRTHCHTLVNSGHYSGPDFSAGDKYISECARGTGSTGNLTTWRRVGTNHHLEFVAHGIASLYEISDSSSLGDGVPPS